MIRRGNSDSEKPSDSDKENKSFQPQPEKQLLAQYASDFKIYKAHSANLAAATAAISSSGEVDAKNAATLLDGYPPTSCIGLLNHAVEGLSVASKAAGAFMAGNAEENTRRNFLASIQRMLFLMEQQKQEADKNRHQVLLELEQQKQEAQKNQKKMEELNQENAALKKELHEAKIEKERLGERLKSAQDLTDLFKDKLLTKIDRGFSEIGSRVGLAAEAESHISRLAPQNGQPDLKLVAPQQPKPKRNVAEDCARMLKYWSPARIFLLIILTDAAYNDPAAKQLETILSGLKQQPALRETPQGEVLRDCLEEYQRVTSSLTLTPEQAMKLRQGFSHSIRELYKQKMAPNEVIAHLKQASAGGRDQKMMASSHPFFMIALPCLESLASTKKLPLELADPVLANPKEEAAKQLKCYRLLKDGSFLPPVSMDKGFSEDMHSFNDEYRRLTEPEAQNGAKKLAGKR